MMGVMEKKLVAKKQTTPTKSIRIQGIRAYLSRHPVSESLPLNTPIQGDLDASVYFPKKRWAWEYLDVELCFVIVAPYWICLEKFEEGKLLCGDNFR
jgi:hypothetical protein